MPNDVLLERFFDALINGDRPTSRSILRDAAKLTQRPQDLVPALLWPTYEQIERLYRSDQLSKLSHHCATRLLRVLCDQNAGAYSIAPANGRSILAFCGPRDSDELGALLAVDMLESVGFTTTFAGGGIPNDEILAQVHSARPDVLLLFAGGASDLPSFRQLVDTLHEIGACPGLQIAVGGGVFNRADGLAEEIGADIWASDPVELVESLQSESSRRAATKIG